MTQLEQANSVFIEAVRKIHAVILAVECNGRIDVIIPQLPSPTARQVFELKAELLRFYPEAELDVRVIGLDEHVQ